MRTKFYVWKIGEILGGGVGEVGQRGQIYDDGWKLNVWWWACYRV